MDEKPQDNLPESTNVVEGQARLKPGPKPKQLVTAEYQGIAIGRDKKVVDPEEVYKLAAIGCKISEIANWFGVEETTLSRNFAAELTKGKEDAKISLRRAMLYNAVNNNNAAVQIFLAKNLLGMSDTPTDSEANAPLPWDSKDLV